MNNQNASLPAAAITPTEPLKSFADFKLKPEILDALSQMGFETPTPVQSQCYECAMSGVDAVIMAQTGTGKTAAFGIPLVQQIDVFQKSVQALILVPTRELALQVSREVAAIGKVIGAKCIPVYGGTSFSNQVKDYESGAQIIVGTPGRVLDHLKRRTMNFGQLKKVVLDEADEMLSMGFEKELQEIMEVLPEDRQTLLFSATIPDDIRRLAGKYMGEFVTVSVSGDAVGASEISHFVYLVSGSGRIRDLVRVLDEEQPRSAIIFCNTKDETQFVSKSLRDNGYQASAISSDLSQADREKVLGKIRSNQIQFLVATDVAARGIDISHLSHVINFSFPDSLERYIHRTGRTGRQGKHGAAISLITPQDIGNLYMLRLTYKIFPVEKKLPEETNKSLQDELSMLEYFRNSVRGTEVEKKYFGLATRLLHSSDAQHLVGVLLQQLFDEGKITTTIAMSSAAAPVVTQTAPSPDVAVAKSTTQQQRTAEKNSSAPAVSKASEASVPVEAPAQKSVEQNKKSTSSAPEAAPVIIKSQPTVSSYPQDAHLPTPGPWGSARKLNSTVPAAAVSVPTAKPTAPLSAPAPKTAAPVSVAPPKPVQPSVKPEDAVAKSIVSENQRPVAQTGTLPASGQIAENRQPSAAPKAAAASQGTDAGRPSAAPQVNKSLSRPASLGGLEKSEEQILSERTSIVPDFDDTTASTDIYIDAGRRDGLKISSFMKDIVELSGLQRTDIGKVRMLTRSTFINVPNVNCKAVFKVLSEMTIEGRKLNVEYTEET